MSELLQKLEDLKHSDECLEALVHGDHLWLDGAKKGVCPEKYLQENLDPSFEWLGKDGGDYDNQALYCRFKLGDKFYEGSGYYSSYGDSDYPTNLSDYYEVTQYEQVVKAYKKV